MIHPVLYKNLKISKDIISIHDRLGYFRRRVELSRLELNALPPLERERRMSYDMGLQTQLALAMDAAKKSTTGQGPPSWANNPDVHFKDGQVEWPPGLKEADSNVRLHFLLQLEFQLVSRGHDIDSLVDLYEHKTIAEKECDNDSRWD